MTTPLTTKTPKRKKLGQIGSGIGGFSRKEEAEIPFFELLWCDSNMFRSLTAQDVWLDLFLSKCDLFSSLFVAFGWFYRYEGKLPSIRKVACCRPSVWGGMCYTEKKGCAHILKLTSLFNKMGVWRVFAVWFAVAALPDLSFSC